MDSSGEPIQLKIVPGVTFFAIVMGSCHGHVVYRELCNPNVDFTNPMEFWRILPFQVLFYVLSQAAC